MTTKKFLDKDGLEYLWSKLVVTSDVQTQTISGSFGVTVKAYKRLGVVMLDFSQAGSQTFTQGSWNDICTLPEEYWPAKQFNGIVIDNGTNRQQDIGIYVRITENGLVRAWRYGDKLYAYDQLYGDIVYIAKTNQEFLALKGDPIDVQVNGQSVISEGIATLTVPTNLINGSATGSVRNIYSSTEDSNYTIGAYAFAEGQDTKATGDHSHAGGYETIAACCSQTVIGELNEQDPNTGNSSERGKYAFIIGNGYEDYEEEEQIRSNALAVDWNGKTYFGTPTNNKIAAVGVSNNATSMDIGWDWTNRDGASLALRSVDYATGNEGAFSLIARNETNNSALTGYADGRLNWGGIPVSLQGHTHTNPISVPAQKSISFKATAANTWQYTGLSFTIPSGHQYLVRPYIGWNSGKPTGVGFETSTSMGTNVPPTYIFENANGFSTPPVFLLPAGTFYLFEKRASVPTVANTDYVSFVDLVCYGSIT